jgi:hypothetical protein
MAARAWPGRPHAPGPDDRMRPVRTTARGLGGCPRRVWSADGDVGWRGQPSRPGAVAARCMQGASRGSDANN